MRASVNSDFPMKMTSYAEKVFKILVKKDENMVDPYHSL